MTPDEKVRTHSILLDLYVQILKTNTAVVCPAYLPECTNATDATPANCVKCLLRVIEDGHRTYIDEPEICKTCDGLREGEIVVDATKPLLVDGQQHVVINWCGENNILIPDLCKVCDCGGYAKKEGT